MLCMLHQGIRDHKANLDPWAHREKLDCKALLDHKGRRANKARQERG